MRIFKKEKNKKGAGLHFGTIVLLVLAIVGIWAIFNFATSKGSSSTSLTITPSQSGNVPQGTTTINLFGKTTVKFSSWDFYNKGTNAGSGHLLLDLDGKDGAQKLVGGQYNDDGTETVTAPGDHYKVLLGNSTSSLTAGTHYYPTYLEGDIPDAETYTISGGQYKTAGASQITFTVTNANGQVNTAQGLTTSDDKTIKIKVSPNADSCFGNPSTSGNNILTYNYNSSVVSNVIQYASGVAQSPVGTPSGAQGVFTGISSLYQKVSYEFPVVCGPAEIDRSVRIQTGTTEPSSNHNINITASDVTWGYNTKTFDLIKGYADNNNADLGVADFHLGTIQIS
jgi:hypothetical protein